jgi:hypothetical protein
MDAPGPPPAPDPGAIRRALAECMTLADIDEAMAWRSGTARRRRWLDPDAGGLPPADAELGGMPLWFRATVFRWRAEATPAPRGRRAWPGPDARAPDGPPPGGPPPDAPPSEESAPDADEVAERAADPAGPESRDIAPDEEAGPEAATPEPEPVERAADVPAGVATEDEVAAAGEVSSGFELAAGRLVFAYLRRGWHRAVVRAPGRRTVLVDYQLEGDRLGPRRQRVGIDRIRVPGPPDPG